MKRTLLALLAFLVLASPAHAQLTETALLDTLQHSGFLYFWNETNPATGLTRDRSTFTSFASTAATGFGLSALCIGADHGWITRAQARDRVLTTLTTLWTGPQSSAASGTNGYKGLYYHFLDIGTGLRYSSNVELSTIDTALLFAGIIDAKQYFAGADSAETRLRALADSVVDRADWNFMRNLHPYIMQGWNPEHGFADFGGWGGGYSEGMLLYLLALGSPTHAPPDTATWTTWTNGYSWQTWYGYQFTNCPPLFTHQYPQCWWDLRNKRDPFMLTHDSDYFEDARRATLAQVQYCTINASHFPAYSDSLWGLTASDDPSGYVAHGTPPSQNDDDTITPTAAISSIPFTPTESMKVIRNLWNHYQTFHGSSNPTNLLWSTYGYKDAFNPGFGWCDTDYLGIDQGPIVLMIENYRTQAVWNRFMTNADIQRGMARANFSSYVLGVPGGGQPGAGVALAAPQPNPARGSLTLRYSLPGAGHVRLSLFDLQGREVARLADGERAAGEYSASFATTALAPGVYLSRLEFGGTQRTQRCVVLR